MSTQVPTESPVGSSPTGNISPDNYKLAEQLWRHQAHACSNQPDVDCTWCIYGAYLDGDKKFLKRIPDRTRKDAIALVKRVVPSAEA